MDMIATTFDIPLSECCAEGQSDGRAGSDPDHWLPLHPLPPFLRKQGTEERAGAEADRSPDQRSIPVIDVVVQRSDRPAKQGTTDAAPKSAAERALARGGDAMTQVSVLDQPARDCQRSDTVGHRAIERVRGDRSHLPPQ